MDVQPLQLPGLQLIKPRIFSDARGRFLESFQENRYAAAGISPTFVQDNFSRSQANTLRGLHYQLKCPQGKLVSVTRGEIFDVAVDLRQDSPTFGKWEGVVLNEDNHWQLWVPPGFAHGFCALQEDTCVAYKCTDYYVPEDERVLIWNDPELDIRWPISRPLISDRDAAGFTFANAEYYGKVLKPARRAA